MTSGKQTYRNSKCRELLGMARVIGDGGLFYYIQDVIFIPEYQRQGIGTQLMDGERWNKSERMPAKTRSLA